MEIIRAELRADLRDGLTGLREHLDTRFNDSHMTRDRMHAENLTELRAIKDEAKKTNGRVSVLEERHRSLYDEFQGIRKRWHDFRESIQDRLVNAAAGSAAAGENRTVTMRDVYVYVAGVGSLYALAKLLRWIP
jgi:predicted nuclease with TOPRIM domain